MNGKRGSESGGGREASERLFVGSLENVGEGDVPTDGDAQMGGGRAEGEVRPRTRGNVGAELGKGPVIPRGDDTGFILVDTEARKSGKSGDDGERGEMSETWRADIAKSSAKAKHLMLGRVERAVRRGS